MYLLFDQLQKQLQGQPSKNWVTSPIGIEIVLAILTLVTEEDIKIELLNVLNVKEADHDNYIGKLSKEFAKKMPYVESLADFLKQLGVSEALYKRFIEKRPVDEILKPRKFPFSLSCKTLINHPPNYQLNTKGIEKIQSYFDANVFVDEKPEISITNVFKFNDKWKNDYRLKENEVFKNDKREVFYTEMIECDNIKSLGKDGTFYLKRDEFHAIRLPFEQSNYCFEIYLPFENQSLDGIQDDLTFEKLLEYSSMFQPQNHYYLLFPKTKIESEFDNIAELLKLVGVSKIFTLSDAFNPIIESSEPFFINVIKQKSTLEINEDGVSAESYTRAIFISGISKESEYIEFKVNRPFLYLIRNIKLNKVLFFGKYYQPN